MTGPTGPNVTDNYLGAQGVPGALPRNASLNIPSIYASNGTAITDTNGNFGLAANQVYNVCYHTNAIGDPNNGSFGIVGVGLFLGGVGPVLNSQTQNYSGGQTTSLSACTIVKTTAAVNMQLRNTQGTATFGATNMSITKLA